MKKQLLSLLTLIITISGFTQNNLEAPSNELLVKFKADEELSLDRFENQCRGKLAVLSLGYPVSTIEKFGNLSDRQMYKITFTEDQNIAELIHFYTQTEWFEYVEANHNLEIHGFRVHATDPYYDNQWGFYNDGTFPLVTCTPDADIDMHVAWDTEKGSEDVVVAVLDSGINFDHPEFTGRIWINSDDPADGTDNDGNGYTDDMFGWDFVNNDNDPTDDQGHGTSVTAVIAANANNGLGYAGVDWNCKIMVVKTSNEGGTLDMADLVSGIYYAVNNGADVINISAGGPTPSFALQDAVNDAWADGVIIAASTGNDNSSVKYPAAYGKVIAVGASSADDSRCAPFYSGGGGSCYGASMDIIAPGNIIYSLNYADINDYVNQYSGTSLSCPMVTGVMSLLVAQDPSRTPEDITNILIASAEDQVGPPEEDTPGWDQYFGYGRLNANYALNVGSIGIKEGKINAAPKIFPNPNDGHFRVELGDFNEGTILILDAAGSIVNKKTFKEAGSIDLDLSHLPAGNYLAKMQTTEGKEFGIEKLILL